MVDSIIATGLLLYGIISGEAIYMIASGLFAIAGEIVYCFGKKKSSV